MFLVKQILNLGYGTKFLSSCKTIKHQSVILWYIFLMKSSSVTWSMSLKSFQSPTYSMYRIYREIWETAQLCRRKTRHKLKLTNYTSDTKSVSDEEIKLAHSWMENFIQRCLCHLNMVTNNPSPKIYSLTWNLQKTLLWWLLKSDYNWNHRQARGNKYRSSRQFFEHLSSQMGGAWKQLTRV